MNKLTVFGAIALISGIALTIFTSNDGTDFISGFLVASGICIMILGIKKVLIKN